MGTAPLTHSKELSKHKVQLVLAEGLRERFDLTKRTHRYSGKCLRFVWTFHNVLAGMNRLGAILRNEANGFT